MQCEQSHITPFEHLDMRFPLSKYKINDFQTNVMIEINKIERFFEIFLSLGEERVCVFSSTCNSPSVNISENFVAIRNEKECVLCPVERKLNRIRQEKMK